MRSATRITAERARGLVAASVGPGLTRPSARSRCGRGAANGARRSNSLLLSRAMKVLTIRSSSEWKLMTTSRPPGREQLERRAQGLLELLKLGVDENPKSLKRARCRVLARFAGPDRTSHDVGKLACGSNRAPAFAPSNKRLCNL